MARSVVVLLRNTSVAAVADYLDAEYAGQRDPWLVTVDGDACLYVRVNRYCAEDGEPGETAGFVRACGGEPVIEVSVRVSGRHPGDAQVLDFVVGVLGRFRGAALDDYTDHLWSLQELQSRVELQGHPFFDYKGWYEARRDRS